MKRIVSLTLAALMTLGLSSAAAAADPHEITGMAHDLSFGYSGDPYLGEIAPQDERVEYIKLTDAMFTWDDEYVPAATPTDLTSSQIRAARLTVRASSNSKVLDEVTVNRAESRIEVKFVDELTGTKELDFDFDVILSVNDRQQRDYAMNFTGTLANPVMEVYAETDYADISGGEVLEAMEYVRDIELDLGGGVLINTNLSEGRRYYATASHKPYDGGDEFMDGYPSVSEVIILKTAGFSAFGSAVTLGEGFGRYHVYGEDGSYLGIGSDKLAFADTYYLSEEKLDIPDPAAPTEVEGTEEPEEITESSSSAPIPPATEGTPGVSYGAYPPNANNNPSTGR